MVGYCINGLTADQVTIVDRRFVDTALLVLIASLDLLAADPALYG